MPDLLLELFSEEIPARMQARARDDLRRLVTEGLVQAGLTYVSAGAFSTPRRLTLAVEGLTAESPALTEERKGPRTDAPEAAIEGFLRSTGLTRDQLVIRDDRKAQVFFAVTRKPGRPAAAIVAEVVEQVIRTFPWPKSMRWGAGSLRWVRPLRAILCLLTTEAGAETVPLTVDHLTAGNTTEGHRFLSPGRFAVTGFDDYRARLARAHVVLDAAEREAAIWHDATQMAFARGLEVVPDASLLAEVAGLVEWPVVLMGRIADDFLHLPPEVLQTSMREHQKFFSVRNPATGRIEGFVTVANMETADHGATILAGNQKVLAARLSDARFFWDGDLRVARAGMGDWAEGLRAVTFHNRLGSQADRIARIAALSREIAPVVGADPEMADRAARLAKLDLRSAMVGEFPELQGVMGRYYALAAGEAPEIADAARDHYSPLGPSDAVPTDPVTVAVALADKIDTLTGFWAIDEKPTGSKDPFALRRAALGVIRLVLANALRLSIDRLADVQVLRHQIGPNPVQAARLEAILSVAVAQGMFGDATRDLVAEVQPEAADWLPLIRDHNPSISDSLRDFVHDRLKVYLKDQGIRHDIIDACLAMEGNCDLTLLVRRADALSATLKTDDGANLLQGFKRANNILTQAEAKDGVEYSYGPDPKLAETPEETALFAALDAAEAQIAPAMAAEDFAAAMSHMAALRAPIDAFFTAVQVNVANPVIRRNRLNLLHRIRATCAQVADLTRIEG
ncbi:MAG: glycine--tRNA ligase subunit beta [Paracoccaceae bacterium]|nr:MAG: glycine--tRNA ligase subunit beta [Paracoccaceae bacterium]